MNLSEGPVNRAYAAVVLIVGTLILVGLAVFDGVLKAVIR